MNSKKSYVRIGSVLLGSLKAETGREDGHSVQWSFGLGGREDLLCAGERGSALSAHRPVRRQPRGLFSHWHSSAWQFERMGCACECVCERESPPTAVCHWVHCYRNVKHHLLNEDLNTVLKYRWLSQTEVKGRTPKVMLVCLSVEVCTNAR